LGTSDFPSLDSSWLRRFLRFESIASGDFERVIVENINSRAHFLVLLTPSALQECNRSNDWLRREIETAIDAQRNIVPLMLDGFDFGTPSIAGGLTGKLALLRRYNALQIPAAYFKEAMSRLCEKFLNVPLSAVLHPASSYARQYASQQQMVASNAPVVQQKELTAEEWVERGINMTDPDELLRCYEEAIRLRSDAAIQLRSDAATEYYYRGNARSFMGDLEDALQDFMKAIRLRPDYAEAYYEQGVVRAQKGDLEGAMQDFAEVVRLRPDHGEAYNERGVVRARKGDLDDALRDFTEAILLQPHWAGPYYNRGRVRGKKGDLEGALEDLTEAIRLRPDDARAYYFRAEVWKRKGDFIRAIAGYQKYLDFGGGTANGNQEEIEGKILELKKEL
jgi:tetratricopeptide (TPR) repeat protein